MANFTAGTSFTDGVTNDVTAAKLNALVADAVPTSNLSLNSTTGTIATFNSTTGTIATLNSTTPTFLGAITASTNTINVGSGQIYKDASGNVGIGTASPNIAYRASLTGNGSTIVGGLALSSNSNVTYIGTTGASTADFEIFHVANGYMRFATNNTERLRIDSSGNVIVSGNKSLISNGAGGVASNTSIGSSALASNTTGVNNTASGLQALYSNTTGSQNTASGLQALYSNTTGYNNTASGVSALFSNTTGYQNTASGVNALVSNTTGYNNIASGVNALFSNSTGYNNTASGVSALASNTTGYQNTASGVSALYYNTTGYNNTASGVSALFSNTTGYNNTASGVSALFSNTTGYQNTASGFQAGYGTGSNSNTTGSNNTFIGNESVGASATANNVITLGNGSIATLRCQVTSITALSDKRDKKDIENLSAGLDFVGKLRPVSFVWNTRDKAKVNIPDAGFIAQELLDVQEATGITIPNLVSQENPEKLEAAYATLIPVLVQAIKELKAKVESLEEKNK